MAARPSRHWTAGDQQARALSSSTRSLTRGGLQLIASFKARQLFQLAAPAYHQTHHDGLFANNRPPTTTSWGRSLFLRLVGGSPAAFGALMRFMIIGRNAGNDQLTVSLTVNISAFLANPQPKPMDAFPPR